MVTLLERFDFLGVLRHHANVVEAFEQALLVIRIDVGLKQVRPVLLQPVHYQAVQFVCGCDEIFSLCLADIAAPLIDRNVSLVVGLAQSDPDFSRRTDSMGKALKHDKPMAFLLSGAKIVPA